MTAQLCGPERARHITGNATFGRGLSVEAMSSPALLMKSQTTEAYNLCYAGFVAMLATEGTRAGNPA
jgi:hypothetical protein